MLTVAAASYLKKMVFHLEIWPDVPVDFYYPLSHDEEFFVSWAKGINNNKNNIVSYRPTISKYVHPCL